jgi:WXG100 family type VII secretion target
MGTIKVTPEELREAATYIQNKGSEIETDFNEIGSKINEVTASWEGLAQISFVEDFENLKNELFSKLPEIIEGIYKKLQTNADVIEDTDQQLAGK